MRTTGTHVLAWPLMGLMAASLLIATMGCGTQSFTRDTETTHWHDEETVVFVYTRQMTAGNIATFFRPEPKTMHVRVCTIQDNNEMQCRHQRELTNMLNPHVVDNHDLDDRWRPGF